MTRYSKLQASLRQLLQSASQRWPNVHAITDGKRTLTYQEAAAQVKEIITHWRAAGLESGQRIAIAASREIETIISIIAAVEYGLAYVPLDLSYPADRLELMLEDAQVRAVIGSERALAELRGLVKTFPTLDNPPTGQTSPYLGDHDLIYILFTSGSTGRPKGVAMGVSPLAHLIDWHAQHPRLGQAARTLQFAPLSFDVHFQEIFSTLATGGTLVLPTDSERRDPARLHALLEREKVERLYLPYVALQMLAQADADAATQATGATASGKAQTLAIKDVISAGEQLQITPDIRALFQRLQSATLHNHYGPTETHVVTAFELDGNPDHWPQIPPIGTALPHVRCWIRPLENPIENNATIAANCAAGLTLSEGELLLGGETLAEGYLGRTDLTAERFLEDLIGPDGQPARWYITGDLVRTDATGVITYLGRADQQLKVDGFRIEPGDIELALMAHPGIQDAVVTAPQDPDGSRVLTAHVVLRDHASAADRTIASWRNWLHQRLPAYMVPVRFAILAQLPTTPSGKIDRRSLPAVTVGTAASNETAGKPALHVDPSQIKELLRALWQELLGLEQLSDTANVFDLGARSLLVMRFANRAKELGIRVNVADIYDRPTVAGLAKLLEGSAQSGSSRTRTTSNEPSVHEGMAIIGMAARVGSAENVETFWQQLLDNVESLRRFQPDELDPSVPASLREHPAFVAARGVLENADGFDASFFGLSDREATLIDPQQRLFLELCWTALEHAGVDPSKWSGEAAGRIGVYAGTANNSYLPAMRVEDPSLIAKAGEFAAMLGNEKDYVASRVAHKLNFNGPAVSVHTACSTGLVAVTQAFRALAQGDCEIALAGGATVIVPQIGGYLHVEGGMESADGRCRPFDAEASGTVFGSGGGVVVLKRLSQALQDGDTIFGVIEGVGLNNDGGDKASFTAPSVTGQAKAIRMALDHANVSAREVSYVEAHGTGTALGDPIEVAALARAFGQDTDDTGYCTLGSAKGHVGHLIAAAGVIGLIKATLSLHHGRIPGTLHFRQPNPQIDFASTPFQVSADIVHWPRSEKPRRAGVSSFGVGGTNAHVIVAEAPAQAATATLAATTVAADTEALQILPISAQHPEALIARTTALANFLEQHPDIPLANVSATLMRGRQAMSLRRCYVAENREDAIRSLRAAIQKESSSASQSAATPAHTTPTKPRIVFVFSGQGSQHPGMARELATQFPAFQYAFDEVLSAAPADLAQTLRTLLIDADPNNTNAAAQLAETYLAQPALFAVSCGLAAWLDSLGIRADALIGHSIGEYAAACSAGVMSLKDGMKAVIERGAAMFAQPPGTMLSVRTNANALLPLPKGVEIAAINAPELTTLAGSHDALDAFAKDLEAKGIVASQLKVSHAFHSESMTGALPLIRTALAQIGLNAPQTPLYSCISGKQLSAAEATNPGYWAAQVRAPVAFSPAVEAEISQGNCLFIEVGPGQALTSLIRQHRDQGKKPQVVPLLSNAQAALPPARHALQALAQLWCAGVPIEWPVPVQTPRACLPTYPFVRKPHWFKRQATSQPIEQALPSPTPAAPQHCPADAPNVTDPLLGLASDLQLEALIQQQMQIMQQQIAILSGLPIGPAES
ncbi:hypothetical protein HDN1F_05660 [gamma proteobacterium HdN1]|nr:hypothetical protein HDN1F_05660 [gamma proteobacterium HdN1]